MSALFSGLLPIKSLRAKRVKTYEVILGAHELKASGLSIQYSLAVFMKTRK